jgi:hypothetical protein
MGKTLIDVLNIAIWTSPAQSESILLLGDKNALVHTFVT